MLPVVLGACGFALRTYSFDTGVESFAVTGKTRSVIAAPLRRALSQAGVDEAPASRAEMQVELLDQRTSRRSVSTTGQARTAEYELDYGVQYQILDASGNALLEPVWIERRRIFRFSGDNIVGSSEEQALLERELIQDLVSQIVRSMDAVSRRRADDAAR